MLAVNCQIAATLLTAIPTPHQIVATRFFAIFSLNVIRRTRESLMWLCFLMAIDAFLPCGRADAQAPSSPEEAIKTYMSIPAAQWQQRLPYISDAADAKSHMAREYASSPSTTAAENVVVKGAGNDAGLMRVGDTMPLETTWSTINGEPQKRHFYVTRDSDGYRVNWLRTNMPWLSPGTPEEVVFRKSVGPQNTDRLLPLVADAKAVKPIMERFYSDARNRLSGYTAEQIEFIVVHPEDNPMADGVPFRVLTKERGDESGLYGESWVVKTPTGYKVDWLKTNAHRLRENGAVADGIEAPRRAAPKQAEVIIDSTRKMIAFDEENPADYVGATLRVEPTVGWIDPISVHRDRALKGYTFRWKCGENFQGAEEFGAAGLRRDGLNYVADTELGLSILDKLQRGTSHRIGMTFAIEEQMIDGRRIMVAKLKGIVPGKNSARDRARGQAVIDEILRGH